MEESGDTLAFVTEPIFASLSNLLGHYDNMPSPLPLIIKVKQVSWGLYYVFGHQGCGRATLIKGPNIQCSPQDFLLVYGIWVWSPVLQASYAESTCITPHHHPWEIRTSMICLDAAGHLATQLAVFIILINFIT